MDFVETRPDSRDGDDGAGGAEQRAAPRFTSLIRAAKVVCSQGEFVCVIRDVSATGVSLRMFHQIPGSDDVQLELQNGQTYEMRKVREQANEASFTFDRPVAVQQLIRENWEYPKRPLRLNMAIPLTLSMLTGKADAVSFNISQQGARIECGTRLAIDQTVRIGCRQLPEIRAKVRWRKDDNYGMVFDDTFLLGDFAKFAASVQCPILLR